MEAMAGVEEPNVYEQEDEAATTADIFNDTNALLFSVRDP